MCENESYTGLLYNISFCGQEGGKEYEFRVNRDMYTHLERVGGSAENKILVSKIVMKVKVDGNVHDGKTVDVETMHNLLNPIRLDRSVPYENSALATIIAINQYPPPISILFRSFAASSNFLDYAGGNEYSASGIYGLVNPRNFAEHVIASFKRFCYNSLLTEPIGNSNKQSKMYFLKNTYDKNDPSILCLYNMGLLHKLEGAVAYVSDGETLCNYYVPFDVKVPDISQLSSEVEAVWRKILEDMRVAVASRFHR